MTSSGRPALAAPRALAPGDPIAVIAPSSPFDVDDFQAGVVKLRARYDVRYDEGILSRRGYLAGDDGRRLEELIGALEDPEVRAVVAARGGYGATRLLSARLEAAIAKHPKLLVGFSDVTALHALWARAGWRSLHAAMVGGLGRGGDGLLARWIAAVEGGVPEPVSGLAGLRAGRAEGPLVGGNLSVLAALAPTPFAPPVDGCILFLEDVGEKPYRVDRMLTSLRQAGWLDRAAGVVFGAFTESEPGPDGVTVDEVLAERVADLDVPAVRGLAAGHIDDPLALPLGARVRLDADAGVLTFLDAVAER